MNCSVKQKNWGASSDSAVVDEDMFAERPFSSMLRNLGQAIGIPEKNVYAVKKILERPEVREKLAAVGGTFMFSHKGRRISPCGWYD